VLRINHSFSSLENKNRGVSTSILKKNKILALRASFKTFMEKEQAYESWLDHLKAVSKTPKKPNNPIKSRLFNPKPSHHKN
jgi:hypothetical protein